MCYWMYHGCPSLLRIISLHNCLFPTGLFRSYSLCSWKKINRLFYLKLLRMAWNIRKATYYEILEHPEKREFRIFWANIYFHHSWLLLSRTREKASAPETPEKLYNINFWLHSWSMDSLYCFHHFQKLWLSRG